MKRRFQKQELLYLNSGTQAGETIMPFAFFLAES